MAHDTLSTRASMKIEKGRSRMNGGQLIKGRVPLGEDQLLAPSGMMTPHATQMHAIEYFACSSVIHIVRHTELVSPARKRQSNALI